MLEVMPDQGRLGLIGTPQQPVDSLRIMAPDSDSKTHVYLLVFASPDADPRDWHWSISWQVGLSGSDLKAWRHVHIQVHNVVLATVAEARYIFWGAMTKAEGALTAGARKFSLGKMSLGMRQEIERMALGVPVMRMDRGARRAWNCQDWVKDLVGRIIAAGLVSQRTWEAAVADAYLRAWSGLLVFHCGACALNWFGLQHGLMGDVLEVCLEVCLECD